MPSNRREFIRRCRAAGLIIRSSNSGGHFRIETAEGGFLCPMNSSSSDINWIKNAVRQLAQKGYDITR